MSLDKQAETELATFVEHVIEEERSEEKKKTSIVRDLRTILFLIFIYFLQAIPLGLDRSIPLIMSSRGVNYSDQGTFSLAFWPYSIKLLWAPIVDSFWIKRIGRRRSWVLPINLTMGIFMFLFASICNNLLYNGQGFRDVILLTVIFFGFTFLSATQDIGVDGWAISLLSKENVAWQSITNNVGLTIGMFVSNTFFVVIESTRFCNSYIRPLFNLPPQDHGLVDLKTFMIIFGIIYVSTTVLTFLFKSETSKVREEQNAQDEDEELGKLSFINAYKIIWRLICLKPVQEFALINLTSRIGLATEYVGILKLIEYGVPKEALSILEIPLSMIALVWPFVFGKYIGPKNKMMLFYKLMALKIGFLLVTLLFVYVTPSFKDPVSGQYPLYYYAIYLCYMIVFMIIQSSTFIVNMAFWAEVSDPAIGGTYMTLLATITNLGGTYPRTLALYSIGMFTFKQCIPLISSSTPATSSVTSFSLNSTITSLINENKCTNPDQQMKCKSFGGTCFVKVDAFYIMTFVFMGLGVVWLILFYRMIKRMSNRPLKDWKLDLKFN